MNKPLTILFLETRAYAGFTPDGRKGREAHTGFVHNIRRLSQRPSGGNGLSVELR